ncbi:hypothetical protein [Elizabethkingia anophelis]|uniref:hypothetical protein n=1 Tax=Elizabethkingia anophelis TaxID=1117645 RepID=UPI002227E997|nr:hypothetical protein [Elizabethkingia anophelis]MCW2463354.1 hypothetical protein [Elizabethkingia anophelis]MCW2467039.1 hypothetical protein [Elizabethkingia anophelis]MCW2470813.1 hypothetical protein [Elizabethkingia anophelis]HBI9690685.1 hypothetical protein [Elizabethkingia anophelis]HBI9694704.1 hypothetical protein [Elizabethkingia anophelis]
MEYTKEHGRFYKVLDGDHVIVISQMFENSKLATDQTVVFITKDEYTELTGIEVVEVPEPTIPEHMIPPVIENKPEETKE